MLRGKKQQQRETTEYTVDEDELMGEEYEEQQQQDENKYNTQRDISTKISADGKHLTPKSFGGVQTIRIQIDSLASLEELASGSAQSVWRPLAHLLPNFKHNIASKNRDKAGPEHLAGNLRRCIPLSLRIVRDGNSHAVPLAISIPGLVPRTVHRNGVSHWRVPPNTPVQMVNEVAFEPANPITRHMYDTWKVCNLDTLGDDIQHKNKTANHPKGYSTIATNSLAYAVLCDNLFGLNGADAIWNNYIESGEIDAKEIEDAVENHKNLVEVPTAVAKVIEGVLRSQAEEVAASFINLEDFAVDIQRADGQPKFNSYQGLKGELMGSDIDPHQKLRAIKLQSREHFFVEAELSFLLY